MEGVREIEESKHSTFRWIMSMAMYACVYTNQKQKFQKACSQYAKTIDQVNNQNKGEINGDVEGVFKIGDKDINWRDTIT